MKTAALIPAAGSGTRLGKGPKALLKLHGISLLERCVQIFSPLVDEIVVAISPEIRANLPSLEDIMLVEGGASRQETVYNLVQASCADAVLVHDVARPFLAAALVTEMLETLHKQPAASVVKPVADSLIVAADGSSLDRDSLRAVQTPQGFRREVLLEVHQRAREDKHTATDDASLARRYGYPVELITGDSWLDKITTPADFARAQALAHIWDANN